MVAEALGVERVEDLERDRDEVLGGGHAIQHHGLVAGDLREQAADQRVAVVHQERVVPQVDQVLLGERLHVGEVHQHAVVAGLGVVDRLALERDLQGVAVTMQVAALALVLRDAVAGVEFESFGDREHGIETSEPASVQRMLRSLWVCRPSFH